MVIGEAGESCAFYIADRLGMPNEMLRSAIRVAYGEEAVGAYHFQKEDTVIEKKAGSRTTKIKKTKNQKDMMNGYCCTIVHSTIIHYPK